MSSLQAGGRLVPVEKNIVFRTRSPSLVDTIPLDLGDRSRPVVFFQDRIARRGVKPLAEDAMQAPLAINLLSAIPIKLTNIYKTTVKKHFDLQIADCAAEIGLFQ
jgi:hypothetical protein